MEGGHHGARNALAALAAAFCVLSACGRGEVPVPGRAPVFPFAGELRSAAPGAPALFMMPVEPRLRSVGASGSGYLLWDQKGETLEFLDQDGSRAASWPLEGAFAWIRGDSCLIRGEAFEEGRGFPFVLYRASGKRKPVQRRASYLDCFPSDVLFDEPAEKRGRIAIYVAGGDRDDEENAVFRIHPDPAPVKVFSAPKADGFLRLVPYKNDAGHRRIAVFPSEREKKGVDLRIAVLPIRGEEGEASLAPGVEGLPAGFLCAYGYGFPFKSGIVVPAAMEDGTISLLRIANLEGRFTVVSEARDAKGCYYPLGPDPDGSSFWYLGHDALADPEAWWLVRYDGEGTSAERLDPSSDR